MSVMGYQSDDQNSQISTSLGTSIYPNINPLFENICRLCGSADLHNLSLIFNDDEFNIVGKINKHFDVEVKKSDGLPQKVCNICKKTVNEFDRLYYRCINTNTSFNQMLVDRNLTKSMNIDLQAVSSSPITKRYKSKNIDGYNEIICEFCDSKCFSKSDRIDHLKDKHSNEIFRCDVCNEYLSRQLLTIHMTNHARMITAASKINGMKRPKPRAIKYRQRPPVQCEYCNKILSYLGYRYHLNVVHKKIRNHKCLECDKEFASKRILDNHINSQHKMVRLFECNICEKRFSTDSGLYNHKRIHEIDYKFVCNICKKPFKFRAQLDKHLMIHKDDAIKPKILCNLCGKEFSQKANLSIHQKTHTSSYKFKCNICGFLTKQKRYLSEHMKRLHINDQNSK